MSIAESRAEIVVGRHRGQVTVVVRGPETRATRVPYPPDTQWLGIRFAPGVSVVPQPATFTRFQSPSLKERHASRRR